MVKADALPLSFIEVAPENYLGVGGRRGRLLAMASERWPVVSHGLCGDFSGAAPVDEALTADVARFLREHGARWYSDHLCFTHIAGGESHDLLPLPLSREAIDRSASRIRQMRDRLALPIAIENVSAYMRTPVPRGEPAMTEWAFISAVVEAADCDLLLDVNNVYVNAVNFGVDARAFIMGLPLHRVKQIHMAGHHVERVDDDGAPTLVIDTHGASIIDPVYELLAFTLSTMQGRGLPPPPVLLERDHNIPDLGTLSDELRRLQAVVSACGASS